MTTFDARIEKFFVLIFDVISIVCLKKQKAFVEFIVCL